MATPYVTFVSGRRKLYLWDFSCVNNRRYVVCNACHAEYAEDALHVMATHDAYKNGTHQNGAIRDLHVYCCTTPPPALPKSVIVRISPPGRSGAGLSAIGNATLELPESARILQSDEPDAEREALAVCRWCKGKREITINFKTEPCDCVKQESTNEGQKMENIGRGWKLKKTFRTGSRDTTGPHQWLVRSLAMCAAERHESDWLDQQCEKVEDALGRLSTADKIDVLRQAIDYLQENLAIEEQEDAL